MMCFGSVVAAGIGRVTCHRPKASSPMGVGPINGRATAWKTCAMSEIQVAVCEKQFQAVADVFRRALAENPEMGAAFALFQDGRPVVDLWGGPKDADTAVPWEEDTLCVVQSQTKGMLAGCLAILVWIVNLDEKTLPTGRITDWMAALWITTIAFGYIAQLAPHLDTPSLTSILLGPVGKISFVARISDYHLADINEFLTSSYARPAAPWSAANSWGAAVGILTPFFVQSWLVEAKGRRRTVGIVLLLASALPIILSANRGLWIALGFSMVYFAARKGLRGKFGALAVMVIMVAMVAVALVVTPAGQLVMNRINGSTDSNTARSELYVDAWKGALDSPLVGNGVPRPTNYYKNSPPVGTHGLIWYLMFIHGFVGMFLFLGWLGTVTAKDQEAVMEFDELEVRSLTGAGAEEAVSH